MISTSRRVFAAIVDFVIGDDWRTAVAIVLLVAVAALVAGAEILGTDLLLTLLAVAAIAITGGLILFTSRRS